MDRGRQIENGEVFRERYTVKRMIGRGGAGCVYLVADGRLYKEAAMKVIPLCSGKDEIPESSERPEMAAEAEVLKKLDHPNLPAITDAFEQDGHLFLIMDYIRGETLREVLRRDGAQEQDDVIRWGIALADALSYLHGLDPPIIYRDMKPGNIMLKPNGEVVLFDFGIARQYKEGRTEDTVCLGTIGYAAPEQYGEGQSDERTDVYGLGVTLYHLASGVSPAEPPYAAVPLRRLKPSASAGLEKVIETAVCPDPKGRYQNCEEMKRALMHCRDMDDNTAAQSKARIGAVAVSALVSLLLFAAAIFFGSESIRMKNADYGGGLAEAAELAAESLAAGEYDLRVLNAYSEAIDRDPKREEAYLGLLDYCEAFGRYESGAALISTRVDLSKPFRSTEVLYRLADLYASGAVGNPGRTADLRRAAHYYSLIDRTEYPEAADLSCILNAAGSIGSEVDWSETARVLEHFREESASLAPGERVIRSRLLAAQMGALNRNLFARAGVDITDDVKTLYAMAISDAELLAETGQNTSAYVKQGMLGLAELMEDSPEFISGAVEFYQKLESCSESDEELFEIRMRKIRTLKKSEDEEAVKSAYESMLRSYPGELHLRIEYCTWLFEHQKYEEAADLLTEIRKAGEPEDDPNYRILRQRIEEAL